MKIVSLKLENFQGIKDQMFIFDGNNVRVYGDNGTGKTTLFNALTYLLFDKASTGAKNFTPKTKGPRGDLHNLDHVVIGTFKMEDGRLLKLSKNYHEVYKKTRGKAEVQMTGHTVDYTVDGVPASEKEFQALLSSYFGDLERMKLLTMPDYFSEGIGWEERRKILLEICGDIQDKDVLEGNKELADLKEYLIVPGTQDWFYTVDEYKKIATKAKQEINKKIESIPSRIDEANKAMPVVEKTPEQIEIEVQGLIAEKIKLEEEKAQRMNRDSALSVINRQIAEHDAAIAKARAEHIECESKKNKQVYENMKNIQKQIFDTETGMSALHSSIQVLELEIKSKTELRAKLFEEYKEVSAREWRGETSCPTCHQELPPEQIQSARESFERSKNNRLLEINENGKAQASKEIIAELEKELSSKRDSLMSLSETKSQLEEKLRNEKSNEEQTIDFESTDIFLKLKKKNKLLLEQKENAISSSGDDTKRLTDQISALQTKIEELLVDKSKYETRVTQEQRIKELEEEEKQLAKEYEKAQKGVYLCEQFIRAKVRAITDKINERFENVKFRLFIEQQNGGLKEDCEVMIPSQSGDMVPYTFANNAARINAGLEIIDTLSKHYNISLPVIVDNAESITKLRVIDSQVIELIVSKEDKTLRVEEK